MTSLIDHGYLYGPKGSIRPFDKTPVGERLVLSAREHAYAESVVSSGACPNISWSDAFGAGDRSLMYVRLHVTAI